MRRAIESLINRTAVPFKLVYVPTWTEVAGRDLEAFRDDDRERGERREAQRPFLPAVVGPSLRTPALGVPASPS